MKLLILTSRFPFPIEKGDKLRIYHQIKELSKYHDICLCSTLVEELKKEHLNEIKKYCSSVYTFPLSRVDVYTNILRSQFINLPIQVGYFYKPSIKKQMLQVIEQERPDHIYVQLIRMAEYVKEVKIPKTIDFMDAFSVNTKRWASTANPLMRVVLNRETRKLKEYEEKTFQYFDHHTIISEQDKEILSIDDRIEVIPNGVDFQYYQSFPPQEKKYDISFVGNMGYKPNVEAAKYLVNKVLPIIKKQYPNVKILIAGARPTKEIKQLADSNVTVSGWLDDIRTAYAESSVFVAPLFLGAGLQNKILEAMSIGVPCVTSKIVNNAINAKENEEILLAENPAEFAEKVTFLFENEEVRIKMIKKAQKFVENQFSWTTFVLKLNNILNRP